MNPFLNRWLMVPVIAAGFFLSGAMNQATVDALKVTNLLKTIEKQPARTDKKEIAAEVTERELNAYLAYLLAQEKDPYIDRLTVLLLGNNQVRGNVNLDGEQLGLAMLLGEDLDFDFKGIVQTRNGAGRLDLTDLWLAGRPVDPQTIDLVLHAIALNTETETGNIGDWYELPKGVKRVGILKGKVVLYF
jgi:hypothetical protein